MSFLHGSSLSNDGKPHKRSLRRRFIRWAVIVVVVILIADFLLLPLGIAIYAVWPSNTNVGSPPDGFSEFDLMAVDGTRLAAWYAPSQNGAVIILLPGAGGTRKSVRGRATMLVENGFGVLMFDPRGLGESDGTTNRFGWAGTLDVGGAVSYLDEQPDVRAIGGWGISLGGEVLLGSIGEYPQLVAVIADGATARTYEEKFDLESAGGPLVRFHSWLTNTFVGLLTGDDPPTPILDAIQANERTHLLLIAARDEEAEIDYNRMFEQTAGERAKLWVVPGVGHTGGWGRYRQEYTERVLEFFTETLLAAQ
jgi:fermentation-respiration switch protein FrsA (DUF1100 family)